MCVSLMRSLLLVSVNILWFRSSAIRADCIDTVNWNNGYPQEPNATKYTCNTYVPDLCSNGSFMSTMTWTGGAFFSYPEFNCCSCGKSWPLWYVPIDGSTSIRVTLQAISNNTHASLQCQPDVYGDKGPCSMECKTITNINMTATLTTFVNDTFNDANCTLILQPSNTTNNTSYVIRIPAFTHLIYFSNYSNIFGTQLVCDSNTLSTANTSLMCRFAYRQKSYDITTCSSTTSTSRYIPLGCVDVVDWLNGYPSIVSGLGYTCFEYEIIWQVCANGSFVPGGEWGSGSTFNYPEYSCCACGKGFRTSSSDMQIQTQASVVDVSVSDLAIVRITNCMTPTFGSSYAFNLTCYGPSNISNMTSPLNFTLYGCPLTCFSSNIVDSDKIASTHPVYVSLLTNSSNITFYSLSSNLFPNFIVECYGMANTVEAEMSTTLTSILPTSTFSSFPPFTDSSVTTITTQVDWLSTTDLIFMRSSDSTVVTAPTLLVTSSTGSETKQIITSMTTTLSSSIHLSSEQTSNKLLALTSTQQAEQSTTNYSLDDSSSSRTTPSTWTSQHIQFSTVPQQALSTTVMNMTNATDQLSGWIPPVCSNSQLGLNCTISTNPCIMSRPCLNNGTCLNTNNSQSSSYNCSCTRGYTGTYCEINIQQCQSITCLHRGVCIEKNLTSFECICEPGYEGDHCETVTDYCQNVTCENNAPCRSLLLNFTCECLTSDFTGRYCENKSSSLRILQIVSRSLGFVAVLAIIFAMSTVIFLDILKYFFHIDPMKQERLQYLRKRARAKKSFNTFQKPQIALRFIYVDAAK